MRFYLVAFLLSCSFLAQAQSDNAKKVLGLMELITNYYVDTVNETQLTDQMIRNTLEKLDPHSVYTPAKKVARNNEGLKGNFEGIGIQFQLVKDTIFVVATISGGPSEQVGLMASDRIVTVGDSTVAGIGLSNDKVIAMLRGAKGTKVDVGVKRGKQKKLLDFTITRDKIPIFSVDAAYMATPEIGYIRISRFAAKTNKEFMDAKAKLDSLGMKHLILDLQGNSGGYLNTAFKISDQFLSADKMIVYTEGSHSPYRDYKATKFGEFEQGKLVVLVDGSSASASEIVSGAVQDWDRGLVIGRRTFGKGLVQNPFKLADGSEVRLTVSKYYTPSGRCIQRPYGDNRKAYRQDWAKKLMESGELFGQLDSLEIPDSLKYKTLKKERTVYGGGGVFPDIYVPIDTSANTKYYSQLFRKGVFNSFALDYVDNNRKKLLKNYPDVNAFDQSFEVDEKLFERLLAYGEKEGVEPDTADLTRSGDQMKLYLKAILARNLWRTAAFFQIWNQQNDSYLKAIEVMSDGKYEEFELVEE